MVEACSPLLIFCMRQASIVCRVRGAGLGLGLGPPSWFASIPPPGGHDAPRLGVLWVRVAPGVRSHTVEDGELGPPRCGLLAPTGVLCV